MKSEVKAPKKRQVRFVGLTARWPQAMLAVGDWDSAQVPVARVAQGNPGVLNVASVQSSNTRRNLTVRPKQLKYRMKVQICEQAGVFTLEVLPLSYPLFVPASYRNGATFRSAQPRYTGSQGNEPQGIQLQRSG